MAAASAIKEGPVPSTPAFLLKTGSAGDPIAHSNPPHNVQPVSPPRPGPLFQAGRTPRLLEGREPSGATMSLGQKSELLNLEENVQEPREDGSFQVISEEEASAPNVPSGVSPSPRAIAALRGSLSEDGKANSREAEGPDSSQEAVEAPAAEAPEAEAPAAEASAGEAQAAEASAGEAQAAEASAGEAQAAEAPAAEASAGEARTPLQAALQEKLADLVWFLLLKYRAKEPTSQAEMLREVLSDNQGHFLGVFSQACECMQLVFGIDVTEMEPGGHSYVLNTTLGLTHDGLLSPEQLIPKTGLLVVVLGVILLGGDCASEAHMWEALGAMGVHEGVEHFLYGEPRELLTDVWVREHYLEYRQVAGSDPPRYEFLWGPRAYTETSRMRVLDFILRVNRREHSCFFGF
ncbi:PREDICTED: melanoma-associated antigen 8-like [Condylura cristata]|uniref:melanoma-associated antigen 8-like n=1 Tax=Condylura cristata TaxID=143302 RepID=UPI0003346FB5|nr:PREDICTED: melanoma-associated antigen 8-like [Condylura cristata]